MIVEISFPSLGYFGGILFLTTNLVCRFGEAILNKTHLMMTFPRGQGVVEERWICWE